MRLGHGYLRILIISWLLMAGVVSAQGDDIIRGTATVSDVTVNTDAGFVVTAEGTLPDACTEIGDIEQEIDGDTIRITINTERQRDLMCAQVISEFSVDIEIDTTGLSAGEYQIDVNGITATVSYDPASGAGAQADDAASLCPQPEAGQTAYAPADTAEPETLVPVCFVYPEDYDLHEIIGGLIVVPAELDPDVIPPTLMIQRYDEALDDTDAVQTWLDENYNADDVTYEPVTIDGLPAIRADIVSGEMTQRTLAVPYREMLIVISILPFEADDAESLWETVTAGLVFTAGDEPVTVTLDRAGITVTLPATWRVTTQDGAYLLAPSGRDEPLMRVATVEGLPAGDDLQEYAQAVRELYAENGDEFVTISPYRTGDGVGGVRVVPTQATCAAYYVPIAEDVSRVWMIAESACGERGEIENEAVADIINSVEIVPE